MIRGWTRRDLNPWPLDCKSSDLPADLRARFRGAQNAVFVFNDSEPSDANSAIRVDLGACFTPSLLLFVSSVELMAEQPQVFFFEGGDPSAGSPTDTLLRLNPPC